MKAEDYYELGNEEIGAGNYAKAIEYYTKAISIEPDFELSKEKYK